MKTNYQTQRMKLLLLLTVFVMLLQSCTKDADSRNDGKGVTTYYYLTAGALNQTPYFTNPVFDTISFASDKGDTLTFIKTKTDTDWFCEPTSNDPNNNNMDCYQTIHNIYSTIKGIGLFEVKHIKENKYLNTFIKIKFNDKIFYYDDVAIDNTSFPTFIGDVVINGRSFKKSIYTYDRYMDSLSSISNMNKDYGLFYVNDKINNLKYLINK